jgi:DNA-directed RNA polymerase specialized sigma24 family protein
MRPSNLASHRSALEALRVGTLTFDQLTRDIRPALELRAKRFLRVWMWSGQTSLDAEDLIQEMLVALWRAVDSWDPERAALVPYVDAQLGRACQRRLRQVAGYPDPRRRDPARQVAVDVVEALEAIEPEGVSLETIVEMRERAARLVSELKGLERLAVELVLEGRSIDETAMTIYADFDARLTYRMDSEGHARRMVGAAVRRVTSASEAR